MTASRHPFLALCLIAAAIAQAVAAILFHFAANWWGMAPAVKVGVIDMLILTCAAGAALAAPGGGLRPAWACAGAVLSGVLFGVHGQIWQTGADTWQLFALWTALAALWAVLARADAVWALTAGLGMVALWLWGDHAAPPALLPAQWQVPLLALAPALVALAARVAGSRSGWLSPLLLAAGAAVLGVGGMVGLSWSWRPLAIGLAVAGAVLALLRPGRFGPWPFAVALVLAVFLVEILLLERLAGGDHLAGAVRLLVAAVLLLAGVALVAGLLRRVVAAHLAVLAARLETALSAAVGVGAWIAAGATLAAAVLFIESWSVPHPAGAVAALALAVGAGGRTLWPRPQMFGHHVQAAFVTMAYGAVLVELAGQDLEVGMLAAAGVADPGAGGPGGGDRHRAGAGRRQSV